MSGIEMRESNASVQPYIDHAPPGPSPEALAAELALLRHMALEGELSLRRDQLAAEHQAVTQRLALARHQRQALAEAVVATGGTLPTWKC